VHGKSIFFIEVVDELELFIDKKVIFDENKIPSVRRLPSAVRRPPSATRRPFPPSVSKFCNPQNFLPFNLDTSPFQVKVY
jgi:hypothetical protein